jgi:hypothetical protein
VTLVLAAVVTMAACERAEPDRSIPDAADSVRAAAPVEQAPPLSPEAVLTAELRAALGRLVRGEVLLEGASETSYWFSAETAGALRAVDVDSSGHATVDFHDLRPFIPNASSSAGSASLLNELNTTVFGVAGIRSVEYRMEGSCDVFWEWLQYGCDVVTRESL